ncbi:MAG: trypsin-like peptidase domain-containing protein [Bdellovibrionales bacterium]|nr:trypsin-like peptidase domain-containing protein [Bdellovibrionales bacterium]
MKIQVLFFFIFVLNLTNCNSDLQKDQKIHKQSSVINNKEKTSINPEILERAKKAVWDVSLFIHFEEDIINFSQNSKNKKLYSNSNIDKKNNFIHLGHGTGFFIKPNFMITNFHVIQNLNENTDILSNRDSKELNKILLNKMKVVKVSALYDLALLKSSKKVKDYLKIKKSPIDLNLDSFFLLAYPGNRFISIPVEYHSSQFNRKILIFNREIELGSLKGSSGAPIIDQNAKVVGVKYAGMDSLSISTPFSIVNDFLNGNNRDCSNLDIEECLNEEWLSLKEAYQKGNVIARYRLSIESYQQWANKRNQLKELINIRKKLTRMGTDLKKILTLYNKKNSLEIFKDYEAQLQIYNEKLEKYNKMLSEL